MFYSIDEVVKYIDSQESIEASEVVAYQLYEYNDFIPYALVLKGKTFGFISCGDFLAAASYINKTVSLQTFFN